MHVSLVGSCPGRGRSLAGLLAPPLKGRVFGCALPSLSGPALLSSAPWEEGSGAQSWELEKVLACLLQAPQHPTSNGRLSYKKLFFIY